MRMVRIPPGASSGARVHERPLDAPLSLNLGSACRKTALNALVDEVVGADDCPTRTPGPVVTRLGRKLATTGPPGRAWGGTSFVAAFARAGHAVACALPVPELADRLLRLRIGIH